MPVFTFNNPEKILIDSNLSIPYPSSISVIALPSNIFNISVHLYGLRADRLSDISILLVAPDGKSNLVLMNGVSISYTLSQDPVNISILDGKNTMPSDGPLINASYSPTSMFLDSFPFYGAQPPPPPPYNQPPMFGSATFHTSFLSSNIPLMVCGHCIFSLVLHLLFRLFVHLFNLLYLLHLLYRLSHLLSRHSIFFLVYPIFFIVYSIFFLDYSIFFLDYSIFFLDYSIFFFDYSIYSI